MITLNGSEEFRRKETVFTWIYILGQSSVAVDVEAGVTGQQQELINNK